MQFKIKYNFLLVLFIFFCANFIWNVFFYFKFILKHMNYVNCVQRVYFANVSVVWITCIIRVLVKNPFTNAIAWQLMQSQKLVRKKNHLGWNVYLKWISIIERNFFFGNAKNVCVYLSTCKSCFFHQLFFLVSMFSESCCHFHWP